MRFILFSDVHLHLFPNVPFGDQTAALTEMVRYAEENNINTLLFCGDFFHTHSNIKTEVVYGYHNFLRQVQMCNLTLLGIPGNHDFSDKAGTLHGLFSFDLVNKKSGMVYGQSAIDVEGIPVCGIAYTENKSVLEYDLESVPEGAIVLLHQGVQDVPVNNKGFTLNETLTPDMIPDHIIHAFSGHYHDYHRVSKNLTIPGALMQHGWKDAGTERGFLDVFIDSEKNVHVKRIESSFSDQFRVIDYNEVDSFYKGHSGTRNVKVINCTSENQAKEVRTYLKKYNVMTEVNRPEERVPVEISESSFSSIDLFHEYTKARGLSTSYIEAGKKIIGS